MVHISSVIPRRMAGWKRSEYFSKWTICRNVLFYFLNDKNIIIVQQITIVQKIIIMVNAHVLRYVS